VSSSPRKKLRASRTIEIIAYSWESVLFRELLRVQCVKTINNLLMWGRYPHIDTSPHKCLCIHATIRRKQCRQGCQLCHIILYNTTLTYVTVSHLQPHFSIADSVSVTCQPSLISRSFSSRLFRKQEDNVRWQGHNTVGT
jgi:hypothetical protein